MQEENQIPLNINSFFSGQKLPFIKKKLKYPSVFPYMPQSGELPECIIYIKPPALERSAIVGFLTMRYNTACLVSQPEVLLYLFVFLSPVTRLFFWDMLEVSTGGTGHWEVEAAALLQRTIWAQRAGTECRIHSQQCWNICLPPAYSPTVKVTNHHGAGCVRY